jgi:hypothetical protein
MLRDIRLGDDLDDFCVRCKRIMNHAVVSVINNAPAKVRCRTCHSDHDYRHEQAPPPKVDLRKAALFTEVLKKVSPDAGTVDLVPEDTDDLAEVGADLDAEPEAEIDIEAAALVEVEPVEAEAEAEPVEEAAKPKSKAKAAPKAAPKAAKAAPKTKAKAKK